MRWILGVCLAAALAGIAAAAPSGSDKRSCLRWVDVDTLTRNGPDTVLARSRQRGDFVIKFRGPCEFQRGPENYFVVRLHSRWECVESLGVLDVNEGGACFIESVKPVPSANGPAAQ